jgi:hypothetical protein
MTVQDFYDEKKQHEQPYRDWLKGHSGGYVLDRHDGEGKLHKATCTHIRTTPDKQYTVDRHKICSDSEKDILDFAAKHHLGRVDRCSRCY